MSVRPSRRAVLAAGGLAAAALLLPRGAFAQSPRILNVMLPLEPAVVTPGIETSDVAQTVGSKIVQGLFNLGPGNSYVPALAESWEVSADGLAYTFKLRQGVKWHDGQPFSAADVVFSAGTMMPQVHPRSGAVLKRITEIVALDDHTVRMTLGAPFVAFMSAIAGVNLPILAKHLYEGTEFKTNPNNARPIGTGPFKFGEWRRGEYIHLVRNEDYALPDRPMVDEIYFQVIPDSQQRAIAMETGRVQVGIRVALAPNDVTRLVSTGRFYSIPGSYDGLSPVFALFVNVRRKPLDDKRVRQAILYALDRSIYADGIYQGFGRVPVGPFSTANKYFDGDVVTKYGYDPDKARALLDEAGLTPGANGIRASFSMLAAAVGAERQRIFEVMRQQLLEVGLEMKIDATTDIATVLRRDAESDYDTYFTTHGQFFDPGIAMGRNYLTASIVKAPGNNTGGYSNAEIDALWEKATGATDEATARGHYSRIQQILSDELPIIPIMENDDRLVVDSRVTGLDKGPLAAYTEWDEARFT